MPWEGHLIRSPIHRALSSIRNHRVRHLLMGGQACVLYGAAEFSRDLDVALLPEPANLDALRAGLRELQAEVIAVPHFDPRLLDQGLAVHFRCHHPEADGLRIDVMTRMRGVDPFPELWERRTTFEFGDGEAIEALSLPDLVATKKTQRDKDWPMLRRLLEAHHFAHRDDPTEEQVRFWLQELRTPELLVDVVSRFPELAAASMGGRPLLGQATGGALAAGELAELLGAEERAERERDRLFWVPLRRKLEELRRAARRRTAKPGDGDPVTSDP